LSIVLILLMSIRMTVEGINNAQKMGPSSDSSYHFSRID
jgi:hypothetical protein